jgi:hypothetical protein
MKFLPDIQYVNRPFWPRRGCAGEALCRAAGAQSLMLEILLRRCYIIGRLPGFRTQLAAHTMKGGIAHIG